jgi:hypothetical protein
VQVATIAQREVSIQPLIRAARTVHKAARMIDLILVLATAGFFAFAWGYAVICERMQ